MKIKIKEFEQIKMKNKWMVNLRAGIDLLLFAFGLALLRTCILLVFIYHAVEMADSILKWSSIGAQNKSEYASLNFEY